MPSSHTSRASPWGTRAEDPLQIDANGSLQSWIDNEKIIVAAAFPESFRYIISGPSECGKTVSLKYLFLEDIEFERLYIIGPTGNQYDGLKYEDVGFIKDIKEIPPPDKLPRDFKKLMIFDDARPN